MTDTTTNPTPPSPIERPKSAPAAARRPHEPRGGVCLNLRAATLAKQAADAAPGPKYSIEIYEGLGPQRLSTRKTQPRTHFGTGGVFKADGVTKNIGRPVEFMVSSGNNGPKYDLDVITYGRQVQTQFASAPNPTFGTGPQRYHGSKEMLDRMKEPSPQQYEAASIRNGIFRLSTKKNIQNVKFSCGPRTYNDANERYVASMPSPQEYGNISHIIMKTRPKTARAFSFAGTSRSMAKKGGDREPGPQDYSPNVFSDSTKKRVTGVAFGTGPQRYTGGVEFKERSRQPAPDKYDKPSSMGRQINSRYKTLKIASFGAR